MLKRADAARDALTQAAERASDAGRRLVEIGSAMQERAQKAVRTTRHGSRDSSERLRDWVVEYPLASIGIAAAVAAIVSVFLVKR